MVVIVVGCRVVNCQELSSPTASSGSQLAIRVGADGSPMMEGITWRQIFHFYPERRHTGHKNLIRCFIECSSDNQYNTFRKIFIVSQVYKKNIESFKLFVLHYFNLRFLRDSENTTSKSYLPRMKRSFKSVTFNNSFITYNTNSSRTLQEQALYFE